MNMNSALAAVGLHLVLVGNLLAFLGLHFGIQVIFVALVIMYTVVFAGFCCAARLFTTSVVFVPFVAVKLQLQLVSVIISYAARGCKPAFPEWTFAFEVVVSMMRYVFTEHSEAIVNENTEKLRAPIKRYGESILDSSCREHGTIPEKLVVNEMEHMWLRDADRQRHLHVVVVHFHGGGYCLSDPLMNVGLGNQTHNMLKHILHDKYQLDVSVDVLLVRYRMAPEFVYPTALNDCFDMYMHVLKHENVLPGHVVLSGDSAGAEMSITSCIRLRKESPELQPGAVLCYSPVVDFSDMEIDDKKTPYCLLVDEFLVQCIPMYLRDVVDREERRLVSPINQSLRDLPSIFLQWGSLERFYEQGQRFKAKAEAEGVTNMKFDFLLNMAHDVVTFPPAICPSAEKGLSNGCAFAAKHLAPVLRVKAGVDSGVMKATPFA
ncbi:hypothetical protein PHYPSEUDO_014791 [Phytophthora pseudosyringae]|uniref:Alpha/beta hydrolase fold-3 domain-containing protein n=1 Tax=Phytophthora pseudosyringae TaxID=221518 RepID=A0A8T1V4P4_9STRA|nr:hypothetical protein PHYPSEUDO_014791 [Phytophthora pseudosyringae]